MLISNCELRAGQVVTVSLDKTINISTAVHVKYLIIIDMSFFVKINVFAYYFSFYFLGIFWCHHW